MKTHYPKSYPYLNRNALVFSKDVIENVCKRFLNLHKPKSLELGWELALITRWAMDVATSHTHFCKLIHTLFFQAIKRGKRPNPLGKQTSETVLELLLDPSTELIEGEFIRKMDIEDHIGSNEEVTRLAELRSRDRLAAIERLKKHWQGED